VRDAVPFMRELKRQPGKGICLMGGGELARSLFEAGLIDEVGVNIHPVLLGTGVPMFPGPVRKTDLELIDTRPLEGGCVLANYRVKRD
jgi:dihydrofolate reductase